MRLEDFQALLTLARLQGLQLNTVADLKKFATTFYKNNF